MKQEEKEELLKKIQKQFEEGLRKSTCVCRLCTKYLLHKIIRDELKE